MPIANKKASPCSGKLPVAPERARAKLPRKLERDIPHKRQPQGVESARQIASLPGKARYQRRPADEYGEIDWQKPTKVIARETGLRYSKVYYLRLVLAPDTVRLSKAADAFWRSLDWTRPASELEMKHKVDRDYIRLMRRKYAPDTPWATDPLPDACKPKCDWASVDWKLNDVQIAGRLGCSRQRVAQKRLKLANGTQHPRGTPGFVVPKGFDFQRTNDLIAAELGCCNETARRLRCAHAPDTIGKFDKDSKKARPSATQPGLPSVA